MCGILFSNCDKVTDNDFIQSLDLLKFRGPDVNPLHYFKDNYKLGHTRLKIIDVDNRSNQPLFSENKRYAIIFNGEIYNYLELKAKFNLPTVTESDTEVLLLLYSMLGKEMLHHLNGMFSCVIYDLVNNTFFVARDRLGVKPLYYSVIGNQFIFSSEIAPILKLTNNYEVDSYGLRQYKKLRTFFNNRTIYKYISVFPAGCYMQDNIINKYWELNIDPKEDPCDEELYELLNSSVKYRCISDVPVGCYLSGGLDSTITTFLADKYINDLHTWTIGFDGENEFDFGRVAANKFNTKHHEVGITNNEFIDLAKYMVSIRKEPLSVPNEVLIYKMTLEAKKYNTVVISGEGADELFFGYDRIFRWASSSQWDVNEFNKLYSYGASDDIEIVEDALSPFIKYDSCLNIVSAFFQTAHLHGLLRRLDFATMLASVEGRTPFVDYRIVERLAGVDFNYKLNNNIVKSPLKRLFNNSIPEEIINRPKVGFPVPLKTIFPNSVNSMDEWFNFNLSLLNIDSDL